MANQSIYCRRRVLNYFLELSKWQQERIWREVEERGCWLWVPFRGCWVNECYLFSGVGLKGKKTVEKEVNLT